MVTLECAGAARPLGAAAALSLTDVKTVGKGAFGRAPSVHVALAACLGILGSRLTLQENSAENQVCVLHHCSVCLFIFHSLKPLSFC